MAGSEPIAGYIVAITTPRLGGGDPMIVPCIVAEPDEKHAKELIRLFIHEEEDAQIVGPVGQKYLDAFRLQPEEITHWRWVP